MRFVALLTTVCVCGMLWACGPLVADPPAAAPGPAQPAAAAKTADDDKLVAILMEEKGSEQIRKAIEQPGSIEVKDKPLDQVLQMLSKQWRISIVLEDFALLEESIPSDSFITLDLKGVSRHRILDEVLQGRKLDYHIVDGVLTVTTETRCKEKLATRAYDLQDVIDYTSEEELVELTELLQEAIEPECWAENGGSSSIRDYNKSLLWVRSTERIHGKVSSLLTDIRDFQRLRKKRRFDRLPVGANPLEKNLDKLVSVSWKNVPLREACQKVAAQINVPILFDERSLKEQGAALDFPLTLVAEQIPAMHVLDAIHRLAPQVDFHMEKEILLVTSTTATAGLRELRMYDVGDLTEGTAEGKPDATPLLDLVKARIAQHGVTSKAGPGVTAVEISGTRFLSVMQSQRAHRDINAFLRDLREKLPPKPSTKPTETAADKAIPDPDPEPDIKNTRKPLADAPITKQVEAVVAGNSEFAFDLYRKVTRQGENLVFSPLSISTAFAVLQPAARGTTAVELNKTFHFTLPAQELHPAFGTILDRFSFPGEGNKLRLANRIWVDQLVAPFRPEYLKVVLDNYGAEPTRIDFSDLEAARRTINKWVERKTESRIPELIKPNELRRGPDPLVVTNAVWMDAKWMQPFPVEGTTSGAFHTLDTKRRVRFMHSFEPASYAEVDDVQLLRKVYLGERLSMLLLLPREQGREALEKLEASLTSQKLLEFRQALKTRSVNVRLPKFELRSQLPLKEALQELGLRGIWEFGSADLSGMNQQTGRFLYRALHEAVIEVNEAGTKAAAATGGMGIGGGEPPASFNADHPFLFLVQDNRTGAILFLGRVMKP